VCSSDLEALSKSQAIITFDLDGNIIEANENFCSVVGYQLAEIVGKHHRIFVDPAYAQTKAYSDFWAELRDGKFDRAQYRRIGKGGREIWIEASYNPVFRNGRPWRVMKIATDITATKMKSLDDAAKLDAVSRSQAIIEFLPDGTILDANENFCATLGYRLDEIRGKHHRIFCDPAYVASRDYADFWAKLAKGEFIANEFVRYAKDGRPVWIQAAYNPVLDASGRVRKVVKFATDVTCRMTSIDQLSKAISELASGNLTVSLSERMVPSMEKMRADFNDAAKMLQTTISTICENARVISANSQHLQDASGAFAMRIEKQAASLEETAAALEELTTTVADSSERAREASSLVAQTRQGAEKSGEVVGTAIEAMNRIEQSSKEINNIIGVIDEIAFQTNLLALNAGVEAARAGDSGKGFAVVAQEVRELAQRSAKAAKEIKGLIHISAEQVGSGVRLVHETGSALSEIVGQVIRIDQNVKAIAEAGQQQSVGLREINGAVNMLDQATQQNAATAEETTAASFTLAEEAASLTELLSQFRHEPTTAYGHREIGLRRAG
jgi:methyl-accepting chemotaxis protein